MACTTMALVQTGSLTGATSIEVQGGTVYPTIYERDNTNYDSGTAHEHILGRYFYNITGYGVYAPSANTYPLPLGGSPDPELFERLQYARVTRTINLSDVTSASDANGIACFVAGVVTYRLTLLGYLKNPETPLEDADFELASINIPLSSAASIAGAAKVVGQPRYRYDFRQGGAVPIEATYVMDGAVTLNGTNPFSTTSYSASLVVANDTGTGDNVSTWSGTVIPRQLSCVIDYRTGLPALFQFAGPFTGSVTIG